MPNCAVINCKNSSRVVNRVNGGITYHRFPSDPVYKEKWIYATGKIDWVPSKYSTICSIHFKNDDFVIAKKCRRLCETACPKILVLSMITNGENDDEDKNNRSKQKKNIEIGTSNEKKQRLNLYAKIRALNLKIKRLREQNRRKGKKIIALETMVDCLKSHIVNVHPLLMNPVISLTPSD